MEGNNTPDHKDAYKKLMKGIVCLLVLLYGICFAAVKMGGYMSGEQFMESAENKNYDSAEQEEMTQEEMTQEEMAQEEFQVGDKVVSQGSELTEEELLQWQYEMGNQHADETAQTQEGHRSKKQVLSEKVLENIERAEKQGSPSASDNKQKMAEARGYHTPEGAYLALYEAVFADKGYDYLCNYNAKGNFYGILFEGTEQRDGKTMQLMHTVVYDRLSKNGMYHLFVEYKEYRDMEGNEDVTSIEDMYAVHNSTGEVIASGKKAWSDMGTEEYRNATGE